MKGTWSDVTLQGHPVDVYRPPGGKPPQFALLYLHSGGLETLRDHPAFTTIMDDLELPCICPQGKLSWWADRICPEFDPRLTAEKHLLKNVVPLFQTEFGISPPRIGLLGISMGGQGALRLVFKYPKLFPVVAAISASIDHHELYGQGTALEEMYTSKEQCRQDTATMHVPPFDPPPHVFFCIDPTDARWYRGNDRLHEKLASLGIEHECDLTTRAGGHSWDYFNHMTPRALNFIHQGLQTQSRRLL